MELIQNKSSSSKEKIPLQTPILAQSSGPDFLPLIPSISDSLQATHLEQRHLTHETSPPALQKIFQRSHPKHPLPDKKSLGELQELNQTQRGRLEHILTSPYILKGKNESQPLTIVPITFLRQLEEYFTKRNLSYPISVCGGALGNVFEPSQPFHDLDFTIHVNVVWDIVEFADLSKEGQALEMSTRFGAIYYETRRAVEYELYLSDPCEKDVNLLEGKQLAIHLKELGKNYFWNHLALKDPISLDGSFTKSGNRFSLLSIGKKLDIKTVINITLRDGIKEIDHIPGLKYTSAFDKDAPYVLLNDWLSAKSSALSSIPISVKTDIIPLERAFSDLKSKRLATDEPSEEKYLKALQYITKKGYGWSNEELNDICFHRFMQSEMIISLPAKIQKKKEEEGQKNRLSTICFLINLCTNLSNLQSHEFGMKKIWQTTGETILTFAKDEAIRTSILSTNQDLLTDPTTRELVCLFCQLCLSISNRTSKGALISIKHLSKNYYLLPLLDPLDLLDTLFNIENNWKQAHPTLDLNLLYEQLVSFLASSGVPIPSIFDVSTDERRLESLRQLLKILFLTFENEDFHETMQKLIEKKEPFYTLLVLEILNDRTAQKRWKNKKIDQPSLKAFFKRAFLVPSFFPLLKTILRSSEKEFALFSNQKNKLNVLQILISADLTAEKPFSEGIKLLKSFITLFSQATSTHSFTHQELEEIISTFTTWSLLSFDRMKTEDDFRHIVELFLDIHSIAPDLATHLVLQESLFKAYFEILQNFIQTGSILDPIFIVSIAPFFNTNLSFGFKMAEIQMDFEGNSEQPSEGIAGKPYARARSSLNVCSEFTQKTLKINHFEPKTQVTSLKRFDKLHSLFKLLCSIPRSEKSIVMLFCSLDVTSLSQIESISSLIPFILFHLHTAPFQMDQAIERLHIIDTFFKAAEPNISKETLSHPAIVKTYVDLLKSTNFTVGQHGFKFLFEFALFEKLLTLPHAKTSLIEGSLAALQFHFQLLIKDKINANKDLFFDGIEVFLKLAEQKHLSAYEGPTLSLIQWILQSSRTSPDRIQDPTIKKKIFEVLSFAEKQALFTQEMVWFCLETQDSDLILKQQGLIKAIRGKLDLSSYVTLFVAFVRYCSIFGPQENNPCDALLTEILEEPNAKDINYISLYIPAIIDVMIHHVNHTALAKSFDPNASSSAQNKSSLKILEKRISQLVGTEAFLQALFRMDLSQCSPEFCKGCLILIDRGIELYSKNQLFFHLIYNMYQVKAMNPKAMLGLEMFAADKLLQIIEKQHSYFNIDNWPYFFSMLKDSDTLSYLQNNLGRGKKLWPLISHEITFLGEAFFKSDKPSDVSSASNLVHAFFELFQVISPLLTIPKETIETDTFLALFIIASKDHPELKPFCTHLLKAKLQLSASPHPSLIKKRENTLNSLFELGNSTAVHAWLDKDYFQLIREVFSKSFEIAALNELDPDAIGDLFAPFQSFSMRVLEHSKDPKQIDTIFAMLDLLDKKASENPVLKNALQVFYRVAVRGLCQIPHLKTITHTMLKRAMTQKAFADDKNKSSLSVTFQNMQKQTDK